jgi:hypothetical protein
MRGDSSAALGVVRNIVTAPKEMMSGVEYLVSPFTKQETANQFVDTDCRKINNE